jgi:6-phosphogluconolactonase
MHLTKTNSQTEFLKLIREQLIESFENRDTANFHIALSGGSTPIPIYKDWATSIPEIISQSTIWQVDERYVQANNPDSNQKLIRESLLNPLIGNKPKFNFFDTNLEITESLKSYSKKLPHKFNFTLLGIGSDGHTAGIFPFTKAIESKEKTAHTQTENFAVFDRLTLTFPAILSSEKIIIALKGNDKEQILAEIEKDKTNTQKFPAAKLLKHPNCQAILLI